MMMPLRQPTFYDIDPRHGVSALLERMGVSVLLMAPLGIEHVLAEALNRAPILRSSSPIAGGSMRLDVEPGAVWVAVESPTGSAVIVFGDMSANNGALFHQILRPFESAPAPFRREMVFQGEAEQHVVDLLTDYQIVALAEFEPFLPLAASHGYPVIPITARRAVRHWQHLTADLYCTTLTDGANVYLMALNGRVVLMTPIGEGTAPQWTAPLVAAGDHWIENLEQMVLVAKWAPRTSSADVFDAAARQLVTEVVEAFERARLDVATVPDTIDRRDVWARLDDTRFRPVEGRAWRPPTLEPEVTVIGRIRGTLASGAPFEVVDEISRGLRDTRGTGMETVWRAGDETLLSPEWLTVRSAAMDPQTGHVVLAGHLSHPALGKAPGHDLGAYDGRNGNTFSKAGHEGGLVWPSNILYVGSLKTGIIVPLDATIEILGLDFIADTHRIAVLHFFGSSTGAVSIVEPSGRRRTLTVLDGLAGNEGIRFNSDGTWLLVPRSKDSVLIEVGTGRSVVIGVTNVGWWPLEPSTLLSIHHSDGKAFPVLFDLATNSWGQAFPYIELDVPLLESFPYLWNPAVSADGSEVLAVSPAGVSVEFQKEHGTGHRLVRFTLATGRGHLVNAPFLDGAQTLERDASEPRWTRPPAPLGPLRLHSDLAARLQEPTTTHEWLTPGRWADEAEQPLVMSLNQALAVTKEGRDPARLLPESLAYLVPVASHPEVWGRQVEWLLRLRDATTGAIVSGEISGVVADSWRRFGAAIAAIESGRIDLVDPVGAGLRER